jgi:putative two-component system response regulator
MDGGWNMDMATPFSEKPTILVVDDSPDNLTLMGDLLMKDYRIKVANNGGKALKLSRVDHPPTLILLDIMMPGMDGYEVCRQLKSGGHTWDIPVIFLTTLSDKDEFYRISKEFTDSRTDFTK